MPSLAESPVHILRVWTCEGEREWEVEHAFECPRMVSHIFDNGGCVATRREIQYTCGVQYELDNVGLESLRFQWEKYLPDGEYRIIGWWCSYPAGPWGGEEYDGGLEIDAEKVGPKWVVWKEEGGLMFAPGHLAEWAINEP